MKTIAVVLLLSCSVNIQGQGVGRSMGRIIEKALSKGTKLPKNAKVLKAAKLPPNVNLPKDAIAPSVGIPIVPPVKAAVVESATRRAVAPSLQHDNHFLLVPAANNPGISDSQEREIPISLPGKTEEDLLDRILKDVEREMPGAFDYDWTKEYDLNYAIIQVRYGCTFRETAQDTLPV